jgi:hypothetical protein
MCRWTQKEREDHPSWLCFRKAGARGERGEAAKSPGCLVFAHCPLECLALLSEVKTLRNSAPSRVILAQAADPPSGRSHIVQVTLGTLGVHGRLSNLDIVGREACLEETTGPSSQLDPFAELTVEGAYFAQCCGLDVAGVCSPKAHVSGTWCPVGNGNRW